MKQITAQELRARIEQADDVILIDVREGWEREVFNIGGMHLPMGDLPARYREIPTTGDVVLYCEKGIRSVIAIQRLEAAGYTNLFNLAGGMKAWKE